MTRQQILERIAELDKQINQKVDKNRVPNLNLKHRSFPMGAWISAAFFLALWVFGGMIPVLSDFLIKLPILKTAFLVLGALGVLFSVYRTLMYLIKGRQKVDKKYAAKSEEIMVLQQEKQNLQKQLEKMGK